MKKSQRESDEHRVVGLSEAGTLAFAKMRPRLLAAAERCGLRDARILVALSGGPDSVFLLHAMLLVAPDLNLTLCVGHVDHGLRPESEQDEKFARDLAAARGLPFLTTRVDTSGHAEAAKASLETAARALRHEVLEGWARSEGCEAVVYGHTAQDQAETVLFNVLRGAGQRGLAGIPYRHGMRARPLLQFTREEIRDVLDVSGISYCADASNLDLRHTRNRLRQELLPLLESRLERNVREALCRVAESAAETENYVAREASAALDRVVLERNRNKILLDIERFSKYYSLLQKYMIRSCLEELSGRSVRPDFRCLNRALELIAAAKAGRRVTLHAPWELLIDHDGAVIWNRGTPFDFQEIRPGQRVLLPDGRAFRFQAESDLRRYQDRIHAYSQFIDAARVVGPISLRSPRSDDKFRPLGLGGSKSVASLLSDRKIPYHLRAETPVLACRAGIIWVAGLQLDDRFKITGRTTKLLHLEIGDAIS